MPGHEKHGTVGPFRPEHAGEFDAVDRRHFDIANHQINGPAGLPYDKHSLQRAISFDDIEALMAQNLCDHIADCWLIVDNKDSLVQTGFLLRHPILAGLPFVVQVAGFAQLFFGAKPIVFR